MYQQKKTKKIQTNGSYLEGRQAPAASKRESSSCGLVPIVVHSLWSAVDHNHISELIYLILKEYILWSKLDFTGTCQVWRRKSSGRAPNYWRKRSSPWTRTPSKASPRLTSLLTLSLARPCGPCWSSRSSPWGAGWGTQETCTALDSSSWRTRFLLSIPYIFLCEELRRGKLSQSQSKICPG